MKIKLLRQLIYYLRLDSVNNVTRCYQKILSTIISLKFFKTGWGQLSEYKPIKERYYIVMNLNELLTKFTF